MAFRELEHHATEPAALPLAQFLPLPANAAPLLATQAGDDFQQAGLAAAARSGHQHRPANVGLEGDILAATALKRWPVRS